MKKILILATEFPPCLGGIATYVYQIANAAAKVGGEVTVVASEFSDLRGDMNDSALPFRVVRYPGGIYNYRQLPGLLRRVRTWIKADTWDVIHAADWPNLMALAFLRKFMTFEYQAVVYGTEILSLPRAWQVRLLGVRRLFQSAERICAISNGTRDLLLKTYPSVDRERVEVIPLGISAEWFAEDPAPVDVRHRYHLSNDDFVVLTVARLDERKGHDAVIRALSRLPEDMQKRLVYLIVGAGNDREYAERLRKLAADCKARVILAGAAVQTELKSFYRAADLFCMPGMRHESRIEGFGLVYLEAASQRVPSIGGNIGGVPDVIVDDQTGLLVEPGEDVSIASAIERMMRNEAYRGRLGEQAYQRAGSFTWEACARRTFDL